MKTMFQKWQSGELQNESAFTNLMFQAYAVASKGNQERLEKAFPAEFLPEWQQIELMHIANDTYGNPRYVVHYSELLNSEEENLKYDQRYDRALEKARKIGGRKFHNKQFGGGIVFQSYNTDQLKQQIVECRNSD